MSGGFERDRDEFARGAKAVVVFPDLGGSSRDADARLEETAGLAEAIGVEVVDRVAIRVRTPRAATRAATSTSGVGARPHSRLASAKPIVPATKTRRRPSRSPSEPPSRIRLARASR